MPLHVVFWFEIIWKSSHSPIPLRHWSESYIAGLSFWPAAWSEWLFSIKTRVEHLGVSLVHASLIIRLSSIHLLNLKKNVVWCGAGKCVVWRNDSLDWHFCRIPLNQKVQFLSALTPDAIKSMLVQIQHGLSALIKFLFLLVWQVAIFFSYCFSWRLSDGFIFPLIYLIFSPPVSSWVRRG